MVKYTVDLSGEQDKVKKDAQTKLEHTYVTRDDPDFGVMALVRELPREIEQNKYAFIKNHSYLEFENACEKMRQQSKAREQGDQELVVKLEKDLQKYEDRRKGSIRQIAIVVDGTTKLEDSKKSLPSLQRNISFSQDIIQDISIGKEVFELKISEVSSRDDVKNLIGKFEDQISSSETDKYVTEKILEKLYSIKDQWDNHNDEDTWFPETKLIIYLTESKLANLNEEFKSLFNFEAKEQVNAEAKNEVNVEGKEQVNAEAKEQVRTEVKDEVCAKKQLQIESSYDKAMNRLQYINSSHEQGLNSADLLQKTLDKEQKPSKPNHLPDISKLMYQAKKQAIKIRKRAASQIKRKVSSAFHLNESKNTKQEQEKPRDSSPKAGPR